ncbi:hypothetical protein M7I_5407 [Glarea lozoyensis 74030]|uniref:Uncharacterized protein n=1 Tax=Glarea lozoyensis (strain ATCC 74030 / MF5533) TaxID=1104152 RepID=H0ERT6_GLAL7|nr:hypothetical protein M7I_5407 [Glarea lozoyensis 74030]
MPPKVATDGGATTLTPKETQMLAVVASLMGDVPEVDFNIVASLVGQKYARNARSACDYSVKPATAANAEETEGEEDEDSKPSVKKAAVKKAAGTKKVGARAAPKKSTATKKGKSSKVKKEEDMDENDDGADSAQAEFADHSELNGEDGKSPPPAPAIPSEKSTEDLPDVSHDVPWNSVMNGIEATFPAGYKFPIDATELELYHAHSHQITVEAWRVWKEQNNYYEDRAHTPS